MSRAIPTAAGSPICSGSAAICWRPVAPVAAGGAVFLSQAKPCPLLHIAGKNDQIVGFQNQERAVEAAWKVNSTNAPVEFVVHNGGHAYPNDAPEKIVAFFKQHARK